MKVNIPKRYEYKYKQIQKNIYKIPKHKFQKCAKVHAINMVLPLPDTFTEHSMDFSMH